MKVGVIVGRFQTDELTSGHRFLLDYVNKHVERLVIVVGQPVVGYTNKYPLPFEAIELMLKEVYPYCHVYSLKDHVSDAVWSDQLDLLLTVKGYYHHNETTLYGGRQSFIPYYNGRFKTKLIDSPLPDISASDRRKRLKTINNVPHQYFRGGIIHAVENRFATAYPTVDIAVIKLHTDEFTLRKTKWEVLLARKKGSDKFQFIGGFIDPTDDTTIDAAWRELNEEVKRLQTHELEYVGSKKIDDFRYRGTKDGIITTFYVTYYMGGDPLPSDDLAGGELKWFDLKNLDMDTILPQHHPLVTMLKRYLHI